MATEKTSVSLDVSLLSELDARGARSTVINRDLNRLYGMYRRSLAQIRLSVQEALLISDALNGIVGFEIMPRMLWMEVEEAVKVEHLDTKWEVDGKALVEKLRGMNDIQAMAVIDAAERFWQSPPNEDSRITARRVFSCEEEEHA